MATTSRRSTRALATSSGSSSSQAFLGLLYVLGSFGRGIGFVFQWTADCPSILGYVGYARFFGKVIGFVHEPFVSFPDKQCNRLHGLEVLAVETMQGFMDDDGASSGASGTVSYYSAACDEGAGYLLSVVLSPGSDGLVCIGSFGKVIGVVYKRTTNCPTVLGSVGYADFSFLGRVTGFVLELFAYFPSKQFVRCDGLAAQPLSVTTVPLASPPLRPEISVLSN